MGEHCAPLPYFGAPAPPCGPAHPASPASPAPALWPASGAWGTMTCPEAPSSRLAPKPQKSEDGQDGSEDVQANEKMLNSSTEKQANL